MEKEFFIRNRKNLIENLEDDSIAIVFAGNAPQKSADERYNFTPNRNFYYLTGIDRENIILMTTKSKDKVEEYLYIEKSDPISAKWVGEKISAEESEKKSGIKGIKYLDEFEADLNRRLTYNFGIFKNVYFDFERMDWNYPITKAQEFAKTLCGKYPYIILKDLFPVISDLRTIKSDEEINELLKAISITEEGIKNIMKNSKPGMMEYELEAYFNFTLKVNGVKDYAFNTIAASGINGTVLHYDENNCKTDEDDLILFDLGAQYKYYNADITRTFPVSGKFTKRQREIYNIVLKAQHEVIEMIKPGISYKALNEKCKDVLAEECIKIGLIKEKEEIAEYYYHGVSHYLGLDTHDVGNRDSKLAAGMVITVEPGLYIEKEKIGIRIEDDVLVTKDGHDVLSKHILKTVDEIEKFMHK